MEPRIQYAKTSDGVSIAFWVLGDGAPLVHMWPGPGHIQLEWEIPECRRWYERLARNWMIVRYDNRAMGLSDSSDGGYSLDAAGRDLEAVVDRLDTDKFALLGPLHSGIPAIAYAARCEERISHLVLWCSFTSGLEYMQRPPVQSTRSLIDQDWTTFTEATAHRSLGWSQGEPARRYAALLRESISQEKFRGLISQLNEWDSSQYLGEVTSPTLVLHRRGFYVPIDVARGLASSIAGAQLVLLDGESAAPFLEDMESVASAIDEFLGGGEAIVPAAPATRPSGTAVILFADIADSTALTERLGDAAFRAKARELGGSLRALIREGGGTPVEGPTLGDGVLAAFTSAREAIEAAIRCRDEGNHEGLPLHVGVHAGDVMREKDPDGRANVYGGAVNIAARIAGASAAGEILVSDTVRSLARTSAGVGFEDRGEHALKGVADPQRLFAVVSQRMENR